MEGNGTAEAKDAFEVVVTAFDPADDPPAVRLQRVFGIDAALAERILTRLPATVQRNVPRVRAEYFRKALIKIGAGVEVRDAKGVAVEPLPQPEPKPARPSVELIVADHGSAVAASRGTDDTLFDARARPQAEAPARPDAVSATGAWTPPDSLAPAADRDDISLPAHPTLREGMSAELLLGAPPAAPRASATVIAAAPHAQLPARPQGPAQSPAVSELPVPSAAPAPRSASPALGYDSFRPPPLDLQSGRAPNASSARPAARGLELMSRLPSSVWDAPPQPSASDPPSKAPAHAPHKARAAGREAAPTALSLAPSDDLPSPTAITLDDDRSPGEIQVLSQWEQPRSESMAEPAPNARESHRPRMLRAAVDAGASASQPAPPARAEKPRARRKPAKVGMASRPEPVEALPLDRRSFYESFLDALSLPFAGAGLSWIAAIAAWGVVVAAILVACSYLPIVGIALAFIALTSLIALSADYFRACFWVPAIGEERIERGPELDLARSTQLYLKSGAHLTVFALVTQFPLAFSSIQRLADHVTPLQLLGDSTLWLLAVVPGYVWPMAIAMSALHNSHSAVWNVQGIVRAIYRAPVEYTLIVIFGVITFALTWLLMLLVGRAIGITGILLAGTIGLPLAISHGVLGASLGHLLRARPEAFE